MLQEEIAKSRPGVEDAKRRSDALQAEAAALKQRLIATAARVQSLEQDKLRLDDDVAKLARDGRTLSASFVRQRAQVASLLAVLERVEHDLPPVMTIRPDDALAAAHASMLLGATLPRLYGAAAELAHRLDLLRRTESQLLRRRTEVARNASLLAGARREIDQLLAMKAQEADEAGARYGDLAAKLDAAADHAADLETLLRRVAILRATPATQSLVVVAARNAEGRQRLQRGALVRPVVGRLVQGEGVTQDGPHAPGITFLAPPAAQVVAPADSEVLFAGRYHKAEQVLILRMAGGYDLVLAGVDRVDVRAGDQLLAGEPIGRMPRNGAETRLYFELRQNGKGVNPAPWLEVELRKANRS